LKSLRQEEKDEIGTGDIFYKKDDEKELFDKFGMFVSNVQK